MKQKYLAMVVLTFFISPNCLKAVAEPFAPEQNQSTQLYAQTATPTAPTVQTTNAGGEKQMTVIDAGGNLKIVAPGATAPSPPSTVPDPGSAPGRVPVGSQNIQPIPGKPGAVLVTPQTGGRDPDIPVTSPQMQQPGEVGAPVMSTPAQQPMMGPGAVQTVAPPAQQANPPPYGPPPSTVEGRSMESTMPPPGSSVLNPPPLQAPTQPAPGQPPSGSPGQQRAPAMMAPAPGQPGVPQTAPPMIGPSQMPSTQSVPVAAPMNPPSSVPLQQPIQNTQPAQPNQPMMVPTTPPDAPQGGGSIVMPVHPPTPQQGLPTETTGMPTTVPAGHQPVPNNPQPPPGQPSSQKQGTQKHARVMSIPMTKPDVYR